MDNFTRRSFLWNGAQTCAGLVLAGAFGSALPARASEPTAELKFDRIEKQDSEWRALLEPTAFGILFEEGTERAFSSPLNDEKRAGVFLCAACFLPLFESTTKFDSGTGWPSFWAPIEGRVGTKTDYKLILPRTEYHCARCGGHQGHVFKDGPKPSGERWCNNGRALIFVPQGESLPELRR